MLDIMRPAILLYLFLSSSLLAIAQNNAKVYKDLNAYWENSYTDEPVSIEVHHNLGYYPENDYDISATERYKRKKKLRKRSILVECNDNLYVNCIVINYKWFSPALYHTDRYIYFRGYKSRLPEHAVQMHVAGQQAITQANRQQNMVGMLVLGGLPGVVSSEIPKDIRNSSKRYNYLLEIRSGKVYVIDIPLMQEILGDHPKINRQYMKEGHPEDPASIIRYLSAVLQ